MQRMLLVAWLGWGIAASTLPARNTAFPSAADIARVSDQLKPGDTLVMADGTWTNQAIAFKGHGTAKQPITLRAATPGKSFSWVNRRWTIEGEHLVVSGLFLNNAQSTGDGVKLAGTNCRLTESAVVGGRHKFFVHCFGLSNRVDHCYLAGKTNDSPTLQVEAERQPNYHPC
jgi:poly(beta-D-mannuronate) lyase